MENHTESYYYGAHFSALRSSGSGDAEMLGAGLSGEDLAAVPEHWLSYPAPPASAHTALALLYTFFTASALVGNGLVIYIFSTTKSLRTSSNLLILQLAIVDFIMMAKAPIFIYNSAMKGFALGNIGCQVFALMGAYSGIGASMTNACIAYDRHSTITRPLDGRLSRGKVLLMIAFTWIYATPWALLPLFKIWGRFVPAVRGVHILVQLPVPHVDDHILLQRHREAGVCARGGAQVTEQTSIEQRTQSLRANQQAGAESAEIRIAKAALTVCFLFVASWTPYGVMALIGAFGDQQLLTPG
ncbi:Ultraviolet wavelength-sensitive opsin, partial [Operophtera brumata]